MSDKSYIKQKYNINAKIIYSYIFWIAFGRESSNNMLGIRRSKNDYWSYEWRNNNLEKL